MLVWKFVMRIKLRRCFQLKVNLLSKQMYFLFLDLLMKRPSSETIDQFDLPQNEQIYARLPMKQIEFENILMGMNSLELEEFIQNQELAFFKLNFQSTIL